MNEIDENHKKNLYKWNRHDNKLKSKIKESDNVRKLKKSLNFL